MATASAFSLNVKDYGVTTVVPDDDVARLMYYLHCVTIGVGLDVLQDDLIRYKHYYLLSPARIAVVFKTAIELSPDFFIGKILFRDDEGEVTGRSPNTFISFSAACDIVSLQSDIIIAGKVKNVTKVMFFKSSWIKKFYTDPVERIARAVLGTKHCSHCDGEDRICFCTSCPRGGESKCKPFFDALLDSIIAPPTLTPTPASRRAPSPQPPPSPRPAPSRQAPASSNTTSSTATPSPQNPFSAKFTPPSKNTSSSTTQSVPSRNAPPPIPPRTHTEQATLNNPPPPYRESDQPSSPFFCNTMSVAELKTYLSERGVEFGDVLDKETLCRRAWDAYCDCMTISELNTFLTGMSISTVGCRDVNSRRQKAKDAFEPPTRPSRPPASTDTSSVRFRKDDEVVLTGLNRAEMNGKTATVLSIDHSEGKALVRVEALDRTFKIKLENLKIQEAVEELE